MSSVNTLTNHLNDILKQLFTIISMLGSQGRIKIAINYDTVQDWKLALPFFGLKILYNLQLRLGDTFVWDEGCSWLYFILEFSEERAIQKSRSPQV